MLVLWKNNVSEHKFSLRVKVHHFLLGQHLESVFERRRWAVQGMPLCIHAHFNVGCIVTRSKAILQLLVRPRFLIVYQCRQLRTISGKNWETKSHMLTSSILLQIKILIALCHMMKPKHLISSQLKRWLDCPDSDIQVMSWEWTTPDSPKFYSMEK